MGVDSSEPSPLSGAHRHRSTGAGAGTPPDTFFCPGTVVALMQRLKSVRYMSSRQVAEALHGMGVSSDASGGATVGPKHRAALIFTPCSAMICRLILEASQAPRCELLYLCMHLNLLRPWEFQVAAITHSHRRFMMAVPVELILLFAYSALLHLLAFAVADRSGRGEDLVVASAYLIGMPLACWFAWVYVEPNGHRESVAMVRDWACRMAICLVSISSVAVSSRSEDVVLGLYQGATRAGLPILIISFAFRLWIEWKIRTKQGS